MPEHLHFVEPFFGGGAVLLQKPYEGVSEVVNDLDGNLTNFWQVLQGDDSFRQFKRKIEATPFSEDEFGKAEIYLKSNDPIVRACGFFVRARQSRQGLCKDFATLSRNRVRRGQNEQVSSWLTAIEGLAEVHDRLKRVVILNRDAVDVIRQQDGDNTLFFCDPPYLHETRTAKDAYEFELSFADHVKLLQTLASIKGKFLLSGYGSALYEDSATACGWRRVSKMIDNKASSSKTKELKEEVLWLNF
jgi:DNA adenine methylase